MRVVTETREELVPSFLLTLPITKVDKDKRLVTGVATDETLDKQGDIVDYETAKALFQNSDAWPGNIREMHQPKAVGKAVEVVCDDATRTITVTARISKGAQDTWEKVLDTTLCMYSIGGGGKRKVEKTDDGVIANRLFLERLAEVSLVDNGANPSAKFDIVKTVDGVSTVQADQVEPEEDETIVDKAVAALDSVKPKQVLVVDGTDVLAHLRKLGPGLVTKAVIDAELTKINAPVLIVKSGAESYDIEIALNAVMALERLLSMEMWEASTAAANGSTDGPEVAQVKMLKQATELVLQFLMSEFAEQFTPAQGQPALFAMSDDSMVEMFAKSLTAIVAKAGARHSAKDNDMIQKVHDLSGDLGAACAKAEGDDDMKVDTAEVTKLQTELTATKSALTEQQGIVAKQAETISAFDTRLKTLEGQPAPGGPSRIAVVDKQLGGDPAAPGIAADDEVLKAFDTLAAVSKTDQERLQLATSKHQFMRANGLDTVSRPSQS